MPFYNVKELPIEIVEGNVQRRLFTADKIQLLYYEFPPHKRLPRHSHNVNEQMGYLLSGKMRLVCGDEERIMEPGDFYIAPIGVEHWSETLEEPAILLDIFVPPREDLMKK